MMEHQSLSAPEAPGEPYIGNPPCGWNADYTWTLTVSAGPEPSTQIEAMIGTVDVLESSGESVNGGQATSLRATLGQALVLLANDQV